jgi:hypothetical protein
MKTYTKEMYLEEFGHAPGHHIKGDSFVYTFNYTLNAMGCGCVRWCFGGGDPEIEHILGTEPWREHPHGWRDCPNCGGYVTFPIPWKEVK